MFLFDNNEIIQRLKKYPIFNKFSTFTLRRLVAQSELMTVPADTILFYSQTPSHYVFYVIDGGVELFSSVTFEKKVATVRGGGMLGETSLIADESHGLTARTNRESQLLKISKEVFLNFFQKDTELLMQITKTSAKRLRHMLMGFSSEHYPYKNIVIYNFSSLMKLEKIKFHLQESALQDDTQIYDKSDFEAANQDIVPFLHQCENNIGVNLFLAEFKQSTWDKAVLSHAEYVYFIVTENDFDAISPDILEAIKPLPCDLVIVHEKPEPYSNTIKFYKKHKFTRHHHFRDEKPHYQRLFRFMTGQAIGLVISAGGFRGYAHYGLIKALFESGIPIDFIGGCSIGASVGAGLASNFNWENFKAIYKKSIGDVKNKKIYNFTFPVTSILNGKLPTRVLQETFGNVQIEDLPINFFCITGNLSKREKEVIRFGELWEWLRASLAVPGILPPLVKNGEVYVDGAVCTALPIQDMRTYLDNAGKIISLDVRLQLASEPKHEYFCPPILTFKDILLYKLGFMKKKYNLPKLIDILLEASSIGQIRHDSEWSKKADVIIAPNTSSLSFSNPSIGDPESLIAYEFAKEILKEHQALFARWL